MHKNQSFFIHFRISKEFFAKETWSYALIFASQDDIQKMSLDQSSDRESEILLTLLTSKTSESINPFSIIQCAKVYNFLWMFSFLKPFFAKRTSSYMQTFASRGDIQKKNFDQNLGQRKETHSRILTSFLTF